MNPSIRQTFEDQERAVFDPATNADISAGRVKGESLARSGSETEDFSTDAAEGIISLEQYFPTGTRIALEASTQMDDSDGEPWRTRRLGCVAKSRELLLALVPVGLEALPVLVLAHLLAPLLDQRAHANL